MSAEDFTPGTVQPVAPGLRRITAPNGGVMTGPGTNTYLIGDEAVAIVDPGPDDAAHLDAVETAAAGRARWVLVTHNHPDHSRGARSLAQRLAVPVYAHGAALCGVRERDFAPDHVLGDGDTVTGPDFTLRCLHTPGHAADHLCFLHQPSGVLMAGDHVMEAVTVVIAPPDGDMAAYLQSLERLGRETVQAIAPAHGGLMGDPPAVFAGIREHRLARERQILEALSGGPQRIESMVAAFYPEIPAALQPVAGWQLHAHLIKLRAEGRVSGDAAEDTWRLSAPPVRAGWSQ